MLRRVTFEEIRVVNDCDGPGGDGDFRFTIGAVAGPDAYTQEFGSAGNSLSLGAGDSFAINYRFDVDITNGPVPITVSFRAREFDLGSVDLDTSSEVRVQRAGEIVLSRPTSFGNFACRVLLEFDVDEVQL